MHTMNSSDEDMLDITHTGGSSSAGQASTDDAINTSEGRPRDVIFDGNVLCYTSLVGGGWAGRDKGTGTGRGGYWL